MARTPKAGSKVSMTSTMRKAVSAAMAVVLAFGMVPLPAYAAPASGSDALVAGSLQEEALAPDAQPDARELADAAASDAGARAAMLSVSAAVRSFFTTASAEEDPIYFIDWETKERVTTLHASRTYQLMNADGSEYVGVDGLRFTRSGQNWRKGNPASYKVQPRPLLTDDDDAAPVVLNSLVVQSGDSLWQLPSGMYKVGFSLYDEESFSQQYRVVNDGLFQPYFDFSYESGSQNNHDFSVKEYAERKTDAQYVDADEQGVLALADDTRLQFNIDTDYVMSTADMPQLESVALWKAPDDDTLESYQWSDVPDNPGNKGKYSGDKGDTYVYSRVPEILKSWTGLDELPDWPHLLNFTDDSRLTPLWNRDGDDAASEWARFEFDVPEGDDEAESGTSGHFIVDKANFASAVAEDGVYFPIVTLTAGGETYTYAYYPIEVNATNTASRGDPHITTASLPSARAGVAYEAALSWRTGAARKGEATWEVSSGALPGGLTLAADGTISGTPTAAGSYAFTVKLTETVDGTAKAATRSFTLNVGNKVTKSNVLDELTLGDIEYTPGSIWLANDNESTSLIDVRVPISLDLRDESLSLGATELYCMVLMTTSDDPAGSYYITRHRAADLMSADGTELDVSAVVEQGSVVRDAKTIKSVRVFLLPKWGSADEYDESIKYYDDANASLAFDPGKVANGGLDSEGYEVPTEGAWRTLVARYADKGTDETVTACKLVLKNGWEEVNSGSLAYYYNLPEMPYTQVDNPNITFGSYVRFPSLQLENGLDKIKGKTGRIRIWPYNGATGSAKQQVETITVNSLSADDANYGNVEINSSATFKLEPGAYSIVAEGQVPVYDANGAETENSAWADIAASMKGATAIKGTHPQQYLLVVGPNQGTVIAPRQIAATYTAANIADPETHMVDAQFELEGKAADGSKQYADRYHAGDSGWVEYEASWYRRIDEADPSKDVLIATGDEVTFGASEHPLYVELVPTGNAAALWKSTGKQLVSQMNKVVTVEVARQRLFSGKFQLSCASGQSPADGDSWGVIEVRTLTSKGVSTTNLWAKDSVVTVPNLSSGSTVTFTPRSDLQAGAVSYEVPESQEADFGFDSPVQLVAPLANGIIAFDGLNFTSAEATDEDDEAVGGTTAAFTLDDGATDVKVERVTGAADADNLPSVPFTILDGNRVQLLPERSYLDGTTWKYDQDYYLEHDGETTYRITVTHRDEGSVDRMGSTAADWAAQQPFNVTLSKTNSAASVDEATLFSRGYADMTLDNADGKACNLLLYRETGETVTEDGEEREKIELVDQELTASSGRLRTPFLNAGRYFIVALDADCTPQDLSKVVTFENLRERAWATRNPDSAPPADSNERDDVLKREDVIVENAKAKSVTVGFPTGQKSELVDRSNSSVSVSTAYQGTATIQMHAELAEGAALSQDAYLEVSTNQPSGESAAGFTNVKALNLNGTAVAFSRWGNLFEDSKGNDTQNMQGGNLSISLKEAAKYALTDFPLDMTLVIPRTDTTSAEASVWLVSKAGSGAVTRSLVGTARQVTSEVSIVAPPVAAWKSFYVHGETGAFADVVVYLNGMRAATATADSYGYYDAHVTLPDWTVDDEVFKLTATAQWSAGSGSNSTTVSATSEAAEVTYSTYYPAVERVTMLYQSVSGGDYNSIVSYNRGMKPSPHLAVYRAENENAETDVDPAKTCWLIEFANGELVSNVQASVPRSGAAVELATTDSLKKATAWIKATLKNSSEQDVPRAATEALSTDDLRSFMTAPQTFSYSPDELEISFDYDGDLKVPMQGAVDQGKYEGYTAYKGESISQGDIEKLVGKMASNADIYPCSKEQAEKLANGETVRASDLPSAADLAKAYQEAAAGAIDEYLLMGDGSGDGKNLLLVHHEVTTEDLGEEAVASDVEAAIAAAKPSIEAVESWIYDGGPQPKATDDAAKYKGNWVAHAAGTRTTMDDSYLHYISTVDDAGNVQIETLEEYYIEDTSKHYYSMMRADKGSLTVTAWDELHGQKVVGTYTIAESQVGSDVCGLLDVVDRWDAVRTALDLVLEDPSEQVSTSSASTQSVAKGASVLSAAGKVTTQGTVGTLGLPESIVGLFKGEVQGWGQGRLEKAIDKSPTQEERQKQKQAYRDKIDYTNLDNIDRVCKNGNRVEDLKEGMQLAKGDAQECSKRVAKAVQTGASVSGPLDAAWALAQELPPVKATKDWLGQIVDPYVDGVLSNKYSDELYYLYRQQKNREARGKFNLMYLFRYDLHPDLKKRLYDKWWKDPYGGQLPSIQLHRQKYDPSGIVYEGMLSNPVEGATVKLYTYSAAAASAGLDPAQFLDSTQFGIEDNPQVTGADGRYQWFVPEGYWQVRVSKEGYGSVSTGSSADYGIGATKSLSVNGSPVEASEYWMPVLPVQLDVNIPLYSTAAPTVESVEATVDGVVVTFSKPMKTGTVTAGMFQVASAASGSAQALGHIEPLGAEETAGYGTLAKRFLVKASASKAYPDGANGSDFIVTLAPSATNATSYAGTALAVGEGEEHAASIDQTAQIAKVEISDVWTSLTPVAPISYTAKVANGDQVEVADEVWGSAGEKIAKTGDGAWKKPRIGRTYRYSVTLAAKSGYRFADNLALVYGGVACDAGDYTAAVSDDKGSVTISGFVDPVTVGKATATIALKDQTKTYTGKALAYSGTVTGTGAGHETYEYFSDAACTKPVAVSNVKNAGTYYVRATVEDDANFDSTASAVAKFTIGKATQTITVDSKKSVAMGKTPSLGANTNGDGKLSYKSSNTKVAKVSASGVITPVKVGSATITVSCEAGTNYKAATSKTVAVTVTKGAQAITAANKECVTGKTVSLGAKRTVGTGALSYASSNKKVATVTSKGVVKGVKAGTAKITITAASNANWNKAIKTVTVKVGKANPLVCKAKKATVAVAYNKTKAAATALNVTTTKAQGKLSYANASTNATAKKFTVAASTGKVTVPKATKKGKYPVVVKVTAKGNSSYISGSKTVKYTIQVK